MANTPRINRLQRQGASKAEILDAVNGSRNQMDVSREQLRQIGYDRSRINEIMGRQRQGLPTAPHRGGGIGGALQPIFDASHSMGGGGGGGHRGGGRGNGQAGQGQQGPSQQDILQQYLDAQNEKYNQSAIDDLTSLFDSYGLGSLAPKIAQWIRDGMSESAIVAQLRETPEYKKRFPGMQALKDQGYNAISEAEYLQLEDSYHQALQSAGLPSGFYDQPTDFVKFIANGVDPQELKQRADEAVGLAKQVDPTQRQLLASMYGVSTGDIAAYFLDPKRATPLLQKQEQAIQVASAAKHAGINTDFGNAGHFERLVENGIDPNMAAQGYGQIAQEMDPLKNLADIWGGDWNLTDAENATFFGNADANRKKKRLINEEKAAFSGSSGFNPGVSGQRSTAGLF